MLIEIVKTSIPLDIIKNENSLRLPQFIVKIFNSWKGQKEVRGKKLTSYNIEQLKAVYYALNLNRDSHLNSHLYSYQEEVLSTPAHKPFLNLLEAEGFLKYINPDAKQKWQVRRIKLNKDYFNKDVHPLEEQPVDLSPRIYRKVLKYIENYKTETKKDIIGYTEDIFYNFTKMEEAVNNPLKLKQYVTLHQAKHPEKKIDEEYIIHQVKTNLMYLKLRGNHIIRKGAGRQYDSYTMIPNYMKEWIYSIDENGNKVYLRTEVDIKSSYPLHLGIMLLNQGFIDPSSKDFKQYIKDIEAGEFYEKVQIKNTTRNQTKVGIFKTMFTKKMKIINNLEYGKIFKKKYPEVFEALVYARKVYSSSKLSLLLAEYEAKAILDTVTVILRKMNINFYTVHDSVRCNNQDKEQVENAILYVYKDLYDITPALGIK